MKRAVWATYFHLGSSNTNQNHGLCPDGPDTWCKYKKAISAGDQYDHEKHFHLPPAVLEAIKPTFRDLSAPELLRKCLHGGTQNCNESFNNVLWSKIPKRVFVYRETLTFGTHEAVVSFNEGNLAKCKVLTELGIEPGYFCVNFRKKQDEKRLKKAHKCAQEMTKEARQKRSQALKRLEEQWQDQEGDTPAYAAGAF